MLKELKLKFDVESHVLDRHIATRYYSRALGTVVTQYGGPE